MLVVDFAVTAVNLGVSPQQRTCSLAQTCTPFFVASWSPGVCHEQIARRPSDHVLLHGSFPCTDSIGYDDGGMGNAELGGGGGNGGGGGGGGGD